MTDEVHNWTDEQLDRLVRKMSREYERAASEMRAKQKSFMKDYGRELEQRERALDDSKEARQKHREWLEEQARKQAYLTDMVNQLAEDATRVNEKAMEALNEHVPSIYMENANWASYGIERATGGIRTFALVDEDAVRVIMRDEPDLLPKLNKPKDLRWNRQKFTGAILQGILQGESVDDISKRVASVMGMNRRSFANAARTATTSAENAGRVNSYERAKRMGINLKQEWLATLDGRTRSSHRKLDGQRVDVGQPFKCEHGDIRFPGDPKAHPAEVWNCRCTLIAAVEGFEADDGERWSRLPGDTTYEKWKAERSKRAKGTMLADPEWSNPAVEALETPLEVRQYIKEKHDLEIIGNFDNVPIEHLRGIAAGLDEAKDRFGKGAANTLKINNRLAHPGKYYYDAGTIEIKANEGGTFLTTIHEYVHSVDDLMSAGMGWQDGMMVSNAYSSMLIEKACAQLRIEVYGEEFTEILDRMCGMNQVLRAEVDKPHELLAYSVERARAGKSNELTRILVEMLEANHA